MRRYTAMVLLAAATIRVANNYNVLAVFPFSGKSHFHMFTAVVEALEARGHNVTVVGHFPKRQSSPDPDNGHGTHTDYSLAGTMPVYENLTADEVAYESGNIRQFLLILQEGLDNCEAVMSSGRLNDLMRSRQQFDLVLVEIFNTGCFVSAVNGFGAPIVGITSTSFYPWYSGLMGDIVIPSYVPVNLLPYTSRMTFVQRVFNTVTLVTIKAFYKYEYESKSQQIVNKYLGTLNATVSESMDNVNAVIMNTNLALGDARSLPPGIIEVGGCTYKSPKPLPEDLQQYITTAERGVVYFSMGSILRGASLSSDRTRAFLRAFGRLRGYKVLWKWEDNPPPPEIRPDNVMFVPWMPQFDVLNHPNVKLFISHGGLLGILDALYMGVPVIGIPMFADQFSNINFIVQNKCGLQLNYDTINEQIVYDTISTILENNKYTENVKHLSVLYKDREIKPIENAVYWIEYVARHRVNLLKPVSLQWYEYCLLDVMAFLAMATVATIYLTKRVFVVLAKHGMR